MTAHPTDAPADDRRIVLATTAGFSLALGIGTVAIPLLALDAGYSPATIGFLAALAAATQLLTRVGLPWLLGRYPDRTLVTLAALMMAGCFGLLTVSAALPVFVVAQLLGGISAALLLRWLTPVHSSVPLAAERATR